MSGLLSEVEGKSIKATKDCSSVEAQLQDVQVRPAGATQTSSGSGLQTPPDWIHFYPGRTLF